MLWRKHLIWQNYNFLRIFEKKIAKNVILKILNTLPIYKRRCKYGLLLFCVTKTNIVSVFTIPLKVSWFFCLYLTFLTKTAAVADLEIATLHFRNLDCYHHRSDRGVQLVCISSYEFIGNYYQMYRCCCYKLLGKR